MKAFLIVITALAILAPAGYSQAVLRRGDIFNLKLSGMPADTAQEWMLDYTVGDDGRVKVPYIGEIPAAGMSVNEFARTVERRLVQEKFFTRPTATITVQQQSRFITIGGEIRNPGAHQWAPEMTLSMAIKRAGGIGEWGSLKKIKVTREGKSQIFNLTREAKDPSQNPKLLPGDEIEVQ